MYLLTYKDSIEVMLQHFSNLMSLGNEQIFETPLKRLVFRWASS